MVTSSARIACEKFAISRSHPDADNRIFDGFRFDLEMNG